MIILRRADIPISVLLSLKLVGYLLIYLFATT